MRKIYTFGLLLMLCACGPTSCDIQNCLQRMLERTDVGMLGPTGRYCKDFVQLESAQVTGKTKNFFGAEEVQITMTSIVKAPYQSTSTIDVKCTGGSYSMTGARQFAVGERRTTQFSIIYDRACR